MSDPDISKPRSTTRLRFVAPPGFKVDTGIKTIGRYEILKTLGKGAMGVVYKGRDPLLDRIVAIKTIMSPSGAGKRVRSAYIERFQREAKAAAKMQHPSIVTIFDVGVEAGAPFMVLEYLPGESLADRLDRVRIPLGKAVDIGLDLANAMAFAHKQRIVHRDIKPANVLHAGENRWKLADFGIARMPDSDLTQIGIFMGTPGYSPPEAIQHGRYTAQADVFAWGAVLYELLSGRIPYEGPDTKTTNSYVMRGAARNVRDYDPSIPEPLAEVAMRALSGSCEERFGDASEAERALRKAWEFCLNANMIPPSCLTGLEVPHERVGREMHEGVTPKAPPAAISNLNIPRSTGSSGAPMLVIEKDSQVSDDAPTAVLGMPSGLHGASDDDDLGEPVPPPIDVVPGGARVDGARVDGARMADSSRVASSVSAIADASAQRMATGDGIPKRSDKVEKTSAVPKAQRPSMTWVWIVLIVVLGAAGAAALFLLRS